MGLGASGFFLPYVFLLRFFFCLAPLLLAVVACCYRGARECRAIKPKLQQRFVYIRFLIDRTSYVGCVRPGLRFDCVFSGQMLWWVFSHFTARRQRHPADTDPRFWTGGNRFFNLFRQADTGHSRGTLSAAPRRLQYLSWTSMWCAVWRRSLLMSSLPRLVAMPRSR